LADNGLKGGVELARWVNDNAKARASAVRSVVVVVVVVVVVFQNSFSNHFREMVHFLPNWMFPTTN
jgi:hypothetical protein